ncbi:MAG: hypothetical protein LBC09_05570 [Helicobacteraceae bacterium]|jgi:hypothetical protein|nr:hypothetical protein [Helicobacteraceae bacterium]
MRLALAALLFAIALFADNEGYQPKIIYVTAEAPSASLYVGQVVGIVYNAVITERYFERIETRIGGDDNGTGIKRLSANPSWLRVDENRRRMTIYYQIVAPRAVFPKVETEITLLNGDKDIAIAAPIRIGASRVNANPQFCGVIASDLKVISYKVERYSDAQNILAMELQGETSNLDKFSLSIAQEQGVDSSDNKLPTTKAYYYAIIPPTLNEIAFNYFNPASGDFKRIELAFDLSGIERKSDANLEINPNKRSFPWLNTLALSFLSIVLIGVSIKTRKIAFLGAAAIAVAVILWLALRQEEIAIKTGAPIRLLPIATSTIFYITDHPIQATILKDKKEYIKILLPDEKIGWVKKEETQ